MPHLTPGVSADKAPTIAQRPKLIKAYNSSAEVRFLRTFESTCSRNSAPSKMQIMHKVQGKRSPGPRNDQKLLSII